MLVQMELARIIIHDVNDQQVEEYSSPSGPAPDPRYGQRVDHRAGDSVSLSLGGTPVSLLVYVEDVDSVAGRFVAAGAKTLRAIQNQFYGDRSGTFEDPFGHKWTIATHVEDVSPEEMHRRSEAFKKQQAPS